MKAASGPEILPALSANEYEAAFEIMPASLWLIDSSGLKRLFDLWRAQGVTDLRAWFTSDPARVLACYNQLAVLRVNRHTLTMLGAADLSQLLGQILYPQDMMAAHAEELIQRWNGQSITTTKAALTMRSGLQVSVRVESRVLPGHEADWSRVLYVVNEISAEDDARRQLALSEAYARGLFEQSPVSLWVEDFSGVKALFGRCRAKGITNLARHIQSHPEFAQSCLRAIRVLEVNQHTVNLFGAVDEAELLSRIDAVFQGEVQSYFIEELIELWNGKLQQQHEVMNFTLRGEPLNLIMHLTIMPGYEHDWSRVLVALTDISARKKAEASLAYLGKYDVLTRVYNRSFYAGEIHRLETSGQFPVCVIVADLNGLKPVNDKAGHAAGDAMLRRAGEVLSQAAEPPCSVCRIGGDEFVILMPGTMPAEAEKTIAAIKKLTSFNNQFHATAHELSFSIGHAVCEAGGRIEAAIQEADLLMYQAKRDYYASAAGRSRRRDKALSEPARRP
jgi:diguanylate cyclase (GGDEF)-like protein